MTTTTLITGATDGIGLALARQLAREGERLVLVGRRPLEALDDPLLTRETYCVADLRDPASASTIVRFLEAQGISRLHCLIHNAGVGWHTPPGAATRDRIRETLDVNLRAPILLTHALLPHLEAARGTLVFVSSVLADLPAPEIATYAASKAAIDGLARALRVELRGRVRVVATHPGGTATRMHEKAEMPAEQRARFNFPPAEQVAARILRHARGRRRSPTVGVGNAVARLVGRKLGRPLDWAMRRSRR